ncbi:hypothetical protein FHG87_010850 [Trinorchestia longiramus]|nr:hypothetical protein FHG87_010850 [Trinorchestia longiramus]
MDVPLSPTGEALEVFERTPGCVTVAVSAWPPLVDVRPLPFTGSHVSVFRLVMDGLKWCYYLAATRDDQWGDKLNGTWTGMVGMVHRKVRKTDMVGMTYRSRFIRLIGCY